MTSLRIAVLLACLAVASGWLAHFWSLTPADLKGRTDVVSGLMLESLNVFQTLNPNR